MPQETMQILGLSLGSGILVTLVRIAILAGRYMQRLDAVEADVKEIKEALASITEMRTSFNSTMQALRSEGLRLPQARHGR